MLIKFFSYNSFMTEEERKAQAFIQQLYFLLSKNQNLTKGTDAVFIMGGSGSGKSSFLNMMAGSTITASLHPQIDLTWMLEANPEHAKIGHTTSQTFQPNSWQFSNTLRAYDMPGFFDIRSPEHEIVKSLFIKDVAINAKSFKLIFVVDYYSLRSTRCIPFRESLNQLKQFIPNFNENQDYSLIITKADKRVVPKNAAKLINTSLKASIDERQITIVYQPQQEGIYDYSYLNFPEIIQKGPTITSKCNVPISSEAKLILNETIKVLNKLILKALKAFSYSIKLFYINVMSSLLQAQNSDLKRIFEKFRQAQSSIKQSLNEVQLLSKLKKQSLKLQNQCKKEFQLFAPIYDYIAKKIKHTKFLNEIIEYGQISMEDWHSCINFQCQQFEKSNNESELKNQDIFISFLQDEVNININNPIQPQAHAFFHKKKSIVSHYKGSQFVNRTLSKQDKCIKTIKVPFFKNVNFSGQARFNKSVYVSDSKTINGSFTVQSCSCGNSLVRRCWACNHYDKEIPYSQSVFINKYVDFSGSIPYKGSEIINDIKTITRQEYFNISKTLNQNIPYSGDHLSQCDIHHQCSCQNLAKIVITAKELIQDIQFYRKIIKAQQILKAKMGTPKLNLNDLLAFDENRLNLQGYDVSNNKLTLEQVTRIIHNNLSKSHNYRTTYHGQQFFQTQKSYIENIRFQGSLSDKREVTHKAHIQSNQVFTHSENVPYSGSVTLHTCYMNCSWCTDRAYSKSFSGSENFYFKESVSVTAYFERTETVYSTINYEEIVPWAGVIQHSEWVPYSGNIEVCCERSSSVGSGHHDCTSCSTWRKFVEEMKKIIEVKKVLVNKIQENAQIIATFYTNINTLN